MAAHGAALQNHNNELGASLGFVPRVAPAVVRKP